MTRFQRITAVPIYQRVADAIEREILTGRLQPGDPIGTEEELVTLFGVNRSTIREGLRVLEQNGHIHRRAGRRLHASAPNNDNVIGRMTRSLVLQEVTFSELYEATLVLELGCIDAAIDQFSESDLAGLYENVKAMEESLGDVQAFVRLDCAFHDLVAAASNNRVLQLAREPITRLLFSATEMIIGNAQEGADDIVVAHNELLNAIANRDKDAAFLWTRRHLNAWKRAFERISSLDQVVDEVCAQQMAAR